jgi:RNA ligase
MIEGDIDFPKLESPFKRDYIDNRYLVTPEINLDYQWVFLDNKVVAMEKSDGTNVSVVVKDGKIIRAYNRKNMIPLESNDRLWRGIKASLDHNIIGSYMKDLKDGQHFGELIGEFIQDNPMNVKGTLWIPFNSFGMNELVYDEWINVNKDYESIRQWIKNGVRSKLFKLLNDKDKDIIPEGIVFHRPSTGEMAKLRSDMYDFWYEDQSHRPHKFKSIKPQKPKVFNPISQEITLLKKQLEQKLITEVEFIEKRNLILLAHGINPKKEK